MALLERLAGTSTDPKLPIHAFTGSMHELAEGRISRNDIISFWSLTGSDVTDLDYLIGRYNAQSNANAKAMFLLDIRAVFELAEFRAPGYTTDAELKAIFDGINK